MAFSALGMLVAQTESRRAAELEMRLKAAEDVFICKNKDLELLRKQAAEMLLVEQQKLRNVEAHRAAVLCDAKEFAESISDRHTEFEAQCVVVYNTLEKMRVAVEASNRVRDKHGRLAKRHIKLQTKYAALESDMARLKSHSKKRV
eukprot:2037247-Rhodomonas_salina.2